MNENFVNKKTIPPCMCRMQNIIALRDYQESVTTRQTDGQIDGRTDRQRDRRQTK